MKEEASVRERKKKKTRRRSCYLLSYCRRGVRTPLAKHLKVIALWCNDAPPRRIPAFTHTCTSHLPGAALFAAHLLLIGGVVWKVAETCNVLFCPNPIAGHKRQKGNVARQQQFALMAVVLTPVVYTCLSSLIIYLSQERRGLRTAVQLPATRGTTPTAYWGVLPRYPSIHFSRQRNDKDANPLIAVPFSGTRREMKMPFT